MVVLQLLGISCSCYNNNCITKLWCLGLEGVGQGCQLVVNQFHWLGRHQVPKGVGQGCQFIALQVQFIECRQVPKVVRQGCQLVANQPQGFESCQVPEVVGQGRQFVSNQNQCPECRQPLKLVRQYKPLFVVYFQQNGGVDRVLDAANHNAQRVAIPTALRGD